MIQCLNFHKLNDLNVTDLKTQMEIFQQDFSSQIYALNEKLDSKDAKIDELKEVIYEKDAKIDMLNDKIDNILLRLI